ncbi:MAG: YihY/virulence factor BrkB family protein [Flavobacteriales bacterium]|jgi:membrane protein|tara:strand:- start:20847 stop:21743 length:897 start_codon:yes stop_codon:yes gene_type:complete
MISKLLNFTKKIRPLGLSGLSIYDISSFFYKGLVEGAITTRASSLAFNFFLAFFPSIIVLFTLIPYIPIDGFQEILMDILMNILPPSTNQITLETLDDIINNQRGGLLSLGFVLAIYFSTNGINSLIEAFNASYHISKTESILKQRFLSLIITFTLTIMLIITIALIIFGQFIINYLTEYQFISSHEKILFNMAKWLILISMLFLGISTIFNLGPSLKNKWKTFSPGAIFSTVFIIVTSLGFTYYIDNFGQYNKIYGSIGTLIIILLWIYFNAIILLTGFEINASIINAKKKINNLNL